MEFIVWVLLIVGICKIFTFFGTGKIFKLIWGIILCVAASFIHDHNKVTEYKVRELEKNTVFTITDSSSTFSEGDSIWVNMSTNKIDAGDSVAMKCLIIKKQ